MLKKLVSVSALAAGLLLMCSPLGAQETSTEQPQLTLAEETPQEQTLVLTLEDALKIALSENVSVKVADMEVERVGYARKGAYGQLLPSIDASGTYSRTIKKQVMYMDFDMSSLSGDSSSESSEYTEETSSASSSNDGFEVGRWNTYSAGISMAMPLINAQLWENIKITGQDVELAVEKARSSRMETVTQVKQAYYGVLLAKEAFEVYKSVYENALANFQQTEKRYNAQKASELEYTRAKSTVQNAIPNVYDSESSVILGLWRLKAVMGIDLDKEIDVAGSLKDYSTEMFRDIHENDDISLEGNTDLRQLAIQAEQLASAIRVNQYAYLPTLSLSFSYSLNAMTNDFKFADYKWSPYSAVGLSLSIPIFSGGQRLNAVRQSQKQYDELLLQKVNSERQIKISIRQYLNQMETYMKNYTAAEAGVETAQKAYDIAAKTYNLGRSTITELNDAQLALTQAQLSSSQAIYNFVVAKSNLEQTLGFDTEVSEQE
jgi:outer membrane protein